VTQFTVNLKQIVRLLGERLYSTPSVVVRELVQNSYDAIRARHGKSAAANGRIDIRVDPLRRTITFADNGSGMDDKELINYLSRLGDGIKIYQSELERKNLANIGEYGIGFFSSFIVADRIDLRTRKVNAKSGYTWSSSGIEGFDVKPDETPLLDAGTSATLVLQQAVATTYTNAETVIQLVKRYCDFLDCPIYLNDGPIPINEMKFPWEQDGAVRRGQWFGSQLNSEPWYHKVGRSSAGRLTFEYAFCCGAPQEHHREKLYCKRMFVTDALHFVPDFLNFIDVAINCDVLQLSLGREGVQTDSTSARLFSQVEELLLQWVAELVRKHRKDGRLVKIIRQNQEVFKELALKDSQFFDKIHPYLLFPLHGSEDEFVTIKDYLGRQAVVEKSVLCTVPESLHSEHRERERFLLRVCEEREIPVIRTEDEEDDELLRRVCTKNGARKRRLSECQDLISASGEGQDASVEQVRQNIERFFNKRTRLVDFAPITLPLAFGDQEILLNASNKHLQALGKLDVHYERLRPIYDCLLRFFAVLDRAPIETHALEELIREALRTFDSWGRAVQQWEEDRRQLTALTDRWWSGPLPLTNSKTRERSITRDGQKFHMRCFIVCPFSDAYRDVVNVVSSVCAEHGILAETAEAPETVDILNKVCRYIDSCDFAIVDISENKPNILLELGLVMARRKPAVIICSKERREMQRISIPTDIIGIERLDYSNTTEDLRQKLTRVLKNLGGSSAKEP